MKTAVLGWDPWQTLLDTPCITLVRAELPAGECGRYYPEQDAIVLDVALSQAQERSTLGHELTHRRLGHTACHDRRGTRRQELEAEVVASRRLIPLEEYVRTRLWTPHLCEQADELMVDVTMLLARRDSLTRDESRYVRTRMAQREGAA